MNKNVVYTLVGVVVVLAIGVFGFKAMRSGNNQQVQTPAPQLTQTNPTEVPTVFPSATASSASSEAMTTSGKVDEFIVTGSNFKFEPTTLTVKKGDTVKVTFKNSGGFHNFIIDEFKGAQTKTIPSGQSETITFVADKAGSFEYYCSVGNHRAMGMRGTLTVQ